MPHRALVKMETPTQPMKYHIAWYQGFPCERNVMFLCRGKLMH